MTRWTITAWGHAETRFIFGLDLNPGARLAHRRVRRTVQVVPAIGAVYGRQHKVNQLAQSIDLTLWLYTPRRSRKIVLSRYAFALTANYPNAYLGQGVENGAFPLQSLQELGGVDGRRQAERTGVLIA